MSSPSTDTDIDNDDNNKSFTNNPNTWIITPIILFILIAICATIIQMRRRRAVRRFAQAHTRPRNGEWGRSDRRPRNRTDLEGGPDDYDGPTTRPGRARRWVGIRAPTERNDVEGLNEFGEAPPPYKPVVKKDDDDVELQNMERGQQEDADGTPATLPPEYSATSGEAGEGVRAPPPAFTRYA